jgi:hypothetical protein
VHQLAAENLLLRKQLALYQERRVKPRRAEDAIQITNYNRGRPHPSLGPGIPEGSIVAAVPSSRTAIRFEPATESRRRRSLAVCITNPVLSYRPRELRASVVSADHNDARRWTCCTKPAK